MGIPNANLNHTVEKALNRSARRDQSGFHKFVARKQINPAAITEITPYGKRALTLF